MLERGEIREKPQHAFSRCHASGERRGKTGCRRLIAGRGGKNLVQRAPRDPAFQRGVRRRVTEHCPGMAVRPLQPGPGERILEKSQLFRACTHGPARLEHIRNKCKAGPIPLVGQCEFSRAFWRLGCRSRTNPFDERSATQAEISSSSWLVTSPFWTYPPHKTFWPVAGLCMLSPTQRSHRIAHSIDLHPNRELATREARTIIRPPRIEPSQSTIILSISEISQRRTCFESDGTAPGARNMEIDDYH